MNTWGTLETAFLEKATELGYDPPFITHGTMILILAGTF